MSFWRQLGRGLAVVAIALAASGMLMLLRPTGEFTLLVYLPGIVVDGALFGLGAGIAAVLLSVASSTVYRIWFAPAHVVLILPGVVAPWAHEVVLLLVGLFVVVLTELRRRSGARETVGAHQMAAVLAYLEEAVIIFGRDMRVVSMNPAAHAMLNRPGETIVGETAASLRERFQFHDGRVEPPPELETVTRAGQTSIQEGTILDVAQNRRIHAYIVSTPWRNHRDEIEGAVVVVHDLTAMKNLQLRALESARHTAVAQMASGLSHDFNHVLDIVRRAVAVLDAQEDAPAAERRKFRAMIDRAAIEGSQIVRRLRDYLAGGSGTRMRLDLGELAHEAVELTRPLWRARPGLEVLEERHSTPPVEGSAQDLQRVLVNLIFNAIEAVGTAPGRIWVRTRRGQGPAPQSAGTACAEVEDTGPGIAPAARAHIFEPYFTTKAHGMGLGLFGARKIAADHGGDLRLDSTAGHGARFVLELPAAPAEQQPAGPASAPAAPARPAA